MGRASVLSTVLASSAVLALSAVLAGCTPAPVFGSIPTGQPGASGPCAVTRTDLPGPVDWRHGLVVFEPAGEASPWTGGRCDDDARPAVLFAHGYVATAAELYQGVIDHLVSNGFVVVFQGYTTEFDPPQQYRIVDTGNVVGVESSGRVDVSRIGVVGHSFGAGMTPWLVQQAAARGWGTEATWMVLFAPHFANLIGSGPIELPDHTRAAVVAYEEDVFVDARIGIELFHAFDLPVDQRDHVTLFTDRTAAPTLFADHLGPVSVELVPFLGVLSSDHYDRWSSARTLDTVAGCAIDGRWCDTDLSFVGSRPDGRPVVPAVVSDDPVDVGPTALQECEFPLNPRPCPG